jgi:ABC-type Fe3+-hydroxamate transport system substrate-binding protein
LASPEAKIEGGGVRVGGAVYPREVVDISGRSIRIDHPPRRIVTQSLSMDEFVYAIADPRAVVAISKYGNDKRFSSVYQIVEKYRPEIGNDPERVVSLLPDLILVASTARADYASLVQSSGAATVRMPTQFATLEDVAQTIRVVGYLTGADEAAAREEARFRAEIAQAAAMKPANLESPRILALSGTFGFGSKTLINDIIARIGGVNVARVAGVKGLQDVSSESIARWNPDWIITGCDPGGEDALRAQMLRDPGIALTRAAKQSHIMIFENHIFEANSPFVTSLVQAMARSIYGAPKTRGM